MKLERLAHRGFRNLEASDVQLAPATTVLVGANGQGKTSFLEAIGVLASTRSFRKARAQELVRHGERSFHVEGTLLRGGARTALAVTHEDARRTTRVGGVPVELSDYVGQLAVVAITQAHAGIVRGSPQDRRDFLDRGILSQRPAYLRALSAHRRTLRHKNALLRRGNAGADGHELRAWSERLARDAAELVVRRRAYVDGLRAVLDDMGPSFLPADEALQLELRDVLSGRESEVDPSVPAAVAEALVERMGELAGREAAAGQALVGAHRDELVLRGAGGRDVRRFASSGQQRNVLLALKMAKVELFRRDRGETPIVLVDDVDTEIDPQRLGAFLEHVEGRAQVLITSSKPELFERVGGAALTYRVEDGTLSPA